MLILNADKAGDNAVEIDRERWQIELAWQHENVKPIKIKKHQRPTKSIFRVRLNFIRDALFNVVYSLKLALQSFLQFIDLEQSCRVK
ncbi:MAG: hypothetical protein PHY16_06380 [Methylobacter sp.]|nr:hypothetical protein [Methylobacter sp.]